MSHTTTCSGAGSHYITNGRSRLLVACEQCGAYHTPVTQASGPSEAQGRESAKAAGVIVSYDGHARKVGTMVMPIKPPEIRPEAFGKKPQ